VATAPLRCGNSTTGNSTTAIRQQHHRQQQDFDPAIAPLRSGINMTSLEAVMNIIVLYHGITINRSIALLPWSQSQSFDPTSTQPYYNKQVPFANLTAWAATWLASMRRHRHRQPCPS